MNRSTDPTDWMWAQAFDLIEQAERMRRQFFRPAIAAREEASRCPRGGSSSFRTS